MESRDDVASSYRMIGGFFRMVLAMATLCFSLPGQLQPPLPDLRVVGLAASARCWSASRPSWPPGRRPPPRHPGRHIGGCRRQCCGTICSPIWKSFIRMVVMIPFVHKKNYNQTIRINNLKNQEIKLNMLFL